MAKKQSHIPRTLQKLRRDGWVADKAERRETSFITRDFLGCIDVLALRRGEVLGVQVCSIGDASTRARKAMAIDDLRRWLEERGRYVVWGWEKVQVKKSLRWRYRVREVRLINGELTCDVPPRKRRERKLFR